MSRLRWTAKSAAALAKELVSQGYAISDDTVGRILKDLGYSLQAPAKERDFLPSAASQAVMTGSSETLRRGSGT